MPDETPDMSGITRGLGALSQGIDSAANSVVQMSGVQHQQDNAVDIARAEAAKAKGFLDMGQAFDKDGNYATFVPRAEDQTKKIVGNAAELIRDPNTRATWLAQSEVDRVKAVGTVAAQASSLRDSATTATYLQTMDDQQKLASDPTVDPAVRNHAIVSIASMIHAGVGTRLFTPEQGYKLSHDYLDGTASTLAVNQAGLDMEIDPAAVHRSLGIPTAPVGDQLATAQVAAAGGTMPIDYPLAKIVADKIGDHNFPQDPAAAKAYLSDPKVNAQYAGQATSILTDRYKGDLTAAVIAAAPGGGTKLADQWVASNHDEKVLPNAVRDYYRTVMTSLSPQTPTTTLPLTAKGVDLSTIDVPVLDRFEKLQAVFGQQLPIVPGTPPTGPADKVIGGPTTSSPGADRGLTVDVSKLSDEDRTRLLKTASAMGFGGIGIADGEMHLDAGDPRVWGADGTPDSVPAAMAPDAATHVATGHTDIPPAYAPVAPRYAAMTFDQRLQMFNRAQQAMDQKNVAARSGIELATQNAPAAISYNGTYNGFSPSANDFVAAYGAADGVQRWQAYSAALDTAHSMYAFKTMPADQIAATVQNAMPGTGDTAGDQAKSFQTLSTAAKEIIKQREDDPAGYVQSAFPDVATAWKGVSNDPSTISNAIAMTAEAEKKLGITKVELLPKDMAHNTAATFNNTDLPTENRIGAVTSTVMMAKAPDQQQAIFQQLVKEGVPDYAQGAMAALERGDAPAAQNLFRAAMVDPEKLPVEMPQGQKPADIKLAIANQLFQPGGVAATLYRTNQGTAKNFDRATLDGTLLTRGVTLHLLDGSAGGDLNKAIDMTSKELFGDMKVEQGQNYQVAVPTSVDRNVLATGFNALLPTVEDAIKKQTNQFIVTANPANGQRAVVSASIDNLSRNLGSGENGHFANSGEGSFAFYLPDGTEVHGADGKPMLFTVDDVKSAAASRDPGRAAQGRGGGGGF